MSSFPVLHTERLVLRAFRKSDVAAIFDMFSRDEVTRYHNVATMKSFEPAEKLVATRASLWEKKIGIRWAIILKGRDDRVIGSCGYYSTNPAFHSIETGYDLHPDHWRQGIMTEALTVIIDYGFSDEFRFHLNRIEALTELENEASIGLLKKLGFQQEGIRREYGYWKDHYHDVLAFSLLRRDWRAQRSRNMAGTRL